jgi:tRNA G18 (ribose-2'-O)-methylase SpoU
MSLSGSSPGGAPPPIVSDFDDARLDDFRNLVDTRWRRRFEAGRNCAIAEGVPLVARLSSRHTPRVLLVTTRAMERPGVVAIVRHHADALALVDGTLLDEVVGFEFRRGIMASFDRPELVAVETVADRPGPLVLLEGLNDAENLGAICRVALAFGSAGVVLDPSCPDPYYRRTVRVSMGAVLDVPIARSSNWPATLNRVRAAGRVLIALTTNPAAAPIEDVIDRVDPQRAAIILGAEGPGLEADTVAHADLQANIGTSSMVDSINVGHAAAIALHRLAAP